MLRAGKRILGSARRHPLTTWYLTLIGLCLIIRLAWGWHMHRRLEAALDEPRKRGEPMRVEEFRIDPLPDEQNALVVYQQAAAAISTTVDSPRNSILEYNDDFPRGPDWVKLAQGSELANAQTFFQARQAKRFPRGQLWKEFPSTLQATMAGGPYNKFKELVNVLSDGAEWRHQQGDDVEAIERLMDVLHVADRVRQDPLLIPQLVGTGIDALGAHVALWIAPGLGDPSRAATRPADEKQVRQLIYLLLDEERAWQGQVEYFAGERLLSLKYVDENAKEAWATRPLAEMAKARTVEGLKVAQQAAATRKWSAMKVAGDQFTRRKKLNVDAAWYEELPNYESWFSGPFALDYVFERHLGVMAQRRMAAVSLAIQLYRREHGKWPAKLEDLVPRHLPRVPADPFSDDQRPIGYVTFKGVLPDGRDRPMVYYDPDEAKDVTPPMKPLFGWQQKSRVIPRQYNDLARFNAPPSPKARDDDPDESDAPGEDKKKQDDGGQPAQQ